MKKNYSKKVKKRILRNFLATGIVTFSLGIQTLPVVSVSAEENITHHNPMVNQLDFNAKHLAETKNNKDNLTSEANVSTFEQLESALKNSGITQINILSDINLERHISIPKRNLVIEGNNHTLSLGLHHIQGLSGEEETTLTIKNATITNKNNSGSPVEYFFEAPSTHKWNVNSVNVDYTGERFVKITGGTLTFSGNNSIKTTAENAYVNHVYFKEGSYTGTVSGPFSAFYFNDGTPDGIAEIGDHANVNINVEDHAYPAFFDNIAQINVKNGGALKIIAEGSAIRTLAHTYKINPGLTVEPQASLYLESKGNLHETIESHEKDFDVVLHGKYDIRNSKEGGKIFGGTHFNLNISNQDLNVWPKDGGEYTNDPQYSWKNIELSGTVNSGKITFINTDPAEIASIFKSEESGRISSEGEPIVIPNPVFNDVYNTDKQIGGTGEAGDTIIATIDGKEVGRTVVGDDGTWTIAIDPQPEGTTINVIQEKDGHQSEVVNQVVKKTEVPTPVVNDVYNTDKQIGGTGEAGDTIIATIDGKEVGQTVVGDDGTWTIAIDPQPEGTTINVVQEKDGHQSEAVNQVVKNTEVPAPVFNEVYDTDKQINGTGEVGDTIIATIDGKEVGRTVVRQDGTWSIAIDPQLEGTTINVVQEKDGHQSEVVNQVVKKTEVPAPVFNDVYNTDKQIRGTGEAGDMIIATIDGKEVGRTIVDENGNWSIAIDPQPEGTTINVVQEKGGHQSEVVSQVVKEK